MDYQCGFFIVDIGVSVEGNAYQVKKQICDFY